MPGFLARFLLDLHLHHVSQVSGATAQPRQQARRVVAMRCDV